LTDDEAIALVVAKCRSAKVRSLERPPQVEWIAPLVLPRGVLVDLHGDPKAGKSTVLAHLLRAVLDGGEFFGHSTAKTKAVWFTEQPPPTFAPLLREAGLYEHPDLIVLHHHEVMAASWRLRVAALVQVAKAEGAGVLVIDTFTKLAGIRGEDENQSGSVLTALDALEMAKAAGLTVILVRHDRKSGGTTERTELSCKVPLVIDSPALSMGTRGCLISLREAAKVPLAAPLQARPRGHRGRPPVPALVPVRPVSARSLMRSQRDPSMLPPRLPPRARPGPSSHCPGKTRHSGRHAALRAVGLIYRMGRAGVEPATR
jgi:hypothetical protein